jgi:signal transduction histidine kinase
MADENSNYDFRFRMRGIQKHSEQIVLVEIPEREWVELHESRNVIRTLKEIMNFSDGFFWNQATWEKLLSRLLEAKPAAIGVSLYFGDNIRIPILSDEQQAIFKNPKIVWAADVDEGGRALVPAFSTLYNSNIGIKNLRPDSDGILRRTRSPIAQIPHFATRVAEIAGQPVSPIPESGQINFVGPSRTFRVINFQDILSGHIKARELKNKIIIIGTAITSPGSGLADQLQTPVGRMSRAEVLANVTDNVIGKKWILKLPNALHLLVLAFLVIFSIWILSRYPQSVALVFFIWTGTLLAALSAWAFDSYYVWLPALAPALQIGFTYIVFLSYQLSFNEQRNWQLEQEKKYLTEIEQLKNNFVSMMSHDLKTPIAKIQAVVDGMLAQSPDDKNILNLKSLRNSSDDLHKYIQSILQITKIEAKDFKIRKEVIDINEMIESGIAHLLPLAQARSIELGSHLEPMFSIEADRTLLQEVILNLIENAIKYTPPGGRVLITSQETDDNVKVIVQDTGPGIAADEQAKIWGKFTRGKTGVDTRGTGLGLYLVKYFIELHGGRVFLESQMGQGTKIGFSIPVAEDNDEDSIERGV